MSCCTTKKPPWPCGFSVWERSFHAWPVVFGKSTYRIGDSGTSWRWRHVLSAAKSPTSHALGGPAGTLYKLPGSKASEFLRGSVRMAAAAFARGRRCSRPPHRRSTRPSRPEKGPSTAGLISSHALCFAT